jgi:uncharacterized coiled-coil DUF342 family protein
MSDQSLYLLTEAAKRTGLTVEAIRQRIKRGSLQAVKGNDRTLRVRLTDADLAGISNRSPTGHVPPTPTSHPTHDDRLLKALQEAAEARGEAATLRERAEKVEAQVDQLQAEREEARIRAAHAEGEAKALREAVAREIGRAEQAEEARKAGEAQRDAVQAELDAWTAGGPLARAWRGFWRGRS